MKLSVGLSRWGSWESFNPHPPRRADETITLIHNLYCRICVSIHIHPEGRMKPSTGIVLIGRLAEFQSTSTPKGG